ncbi:MAG: chromosome partitioning protein ParB [Gammaproteobacteria bacterium]|nr:MAG: chromosome partitioning protein ParB [Gammaproteobacteria bacterium]
MKKRGLGKGLEALMGQHAISDNDNDSTNRRFVAVSALLANPFQPRQVFADESLATLADSIRQHGIIQPLAVREVTKGKKKQFEIIAGERRLRAAKLAGLSEVPIVIHQIDDHDSAALALVENLQREDLNAIEKAKGIRQLIEDFKLTHSACGRLLGQSRSAISNTLRLLELDDSVQQAVIDKSIDMGHARALLGVEQAEQYALLQQIQLNGLSVRETEELVRGEQHQTAAHSTPRYRKNKAIKQTEIKLSEHLQTKVNISQQRGGAGKITLAFSDESSLEKLLHRLGLE